MNREDVEQFIDRARKDGVIDMIGNAAFVMVFDADRPDYHLALQIGLSLLMEKPLLLVVRAGQIIPQRVRDLAAEIVDLEDAPDPFKLPANKDKMTAAIVRQTKRVL